MNNLLSKLALFVFLATLLSLTAAQASVMMGPQFYVKIEVTNLGVDTITRADGSVYTQDFVEFKILGFTEGSSSRVKVGDVIKHKISKSTVRLIKAGDKFIAGVEIGSTMSPTGPVEFVVWSPINREDGSAFLPMLN